MEEEKTLQNFFNQHYLLLEGSLKGLQENLIERMSILNLEPEVAEGMEAFKEGVIAAMVALYANVNQASVSAKGLKQSLTDCNNALSVIEDIQKEDKTGITK